MRIGEEANGEVVRLDVKVFKPYLVTNPEHIKHVLHNQDIYPRGGMFFEPFYRLFGNDSILGRTHEGWSYSRREMQPMFTQRNVNAMTDRIAGYVAQGVSEADEAARTGTPIDVAQYMSRIVNRVIVGLLFGGRITPEQSDLLVFESTEMVKSAIPRLLTPFLPRRLRRPGDRTFMRGVSAFDDVMYSIARNTTDSQGDDLVSLLLRSAPKGDPEVAHRWMRDNMTSIFGAATESTSVTLSYLWPALQAHPEVAARLYAEIDDVVGADTVNAGHLPGLVYTRQVIDEIIRYRPAVWLLSRATAREDVLDGVRVEAGSDILLSPLLTHRSPKYWDRPMEFDPDRFSPDVERPNRWLFAPFGGGQHVCLGRPVFEIESQLIIATLLSRYRPVNVHPVDVTVRLAATLRPSEKVEMILCPIR
jgi:cytochrome P450